MFKWSMFYCYVSLPECKKLNKLRNEDGRGIWIHLVSWSLHSGSPNSQKVEQMAVTATASLSNSPPTDLWRGHTREISKFYHSTNQFIVNLRVLRVLDFASWGAQESLPWSMSRQFQHWPPSKICVFEYSRWRLRRTNWKHADIENETFAAFVVFISDSKTSALREISYVRRPGAHERFQRGKIKTFLVLLNPCFKKYSDIGIHDDSQGFTGIHALL